MPILLLLVSLVLATRYCSEKYTVLKLWSRPNYVDASLNTISIYLLPLMFLIHTIMAIFMFTVPSIFPNSIYDFGLDGTFFHFSSSITQNYLPLNDIDDEEGILWKFRLINPRVYVFSGIFCGIMIF